MEKIEEFVKKIVSEFETKPIATTIKGVIVLWVLKEVLKWFKE